MKCPYRNFEECIVEQCPSCNYEEVKEEVIRGKYPMYWSREKAIEEGDNLINKRIKEVSITNKLIILIKRGNNVIIPKGDTLILKDDILVINDTK